MNSNKMSPRVTKNSFRFTRSCENGASNTLVGIKDKHAYISHNLGITWKQINDVSGTNLTIPYCGSDLIILSDYDTGRLYFLDGKGNLNKEFVFKSNGFVVSVHPSDSNAILLHSFEKYEENSNFGKQMVYYTKDAGVSEWKVLGEHIDMGFDPWPAVPEFRFITGGAPDLIYEYDYYYEAYTAYSLNIFSESPLKFTRFPFVVHQTQDIFYGIKNHNELHVSKDGVNFDQIEFPIHSSPGEHMNLVRGVIEACEMESNQKRAKGSLFLKKRYRIGYDLLQLKYDLYELEEDLSDFEEDLSDLKEIPGYTLFRYDVERKVVKTMLDYCYKFLVVSAERGIIIANYVANPQECVDDKEEPRVKTVITFNDGTDWEPIIGPSGAEFSVVAWLCRSEGDIPIDSSMMIVCGKEGPIENYQEAYYDSSSLSTYMTKDSGRTWRKISDDAMNWMIGGGDDIIVMAQQGKEHILYSLDGGMKWHKLTVGFPVYITTDNSSISGKRFWLGRCTISFDPADQLEQSCL